MLFHRDEVLPTVCRACRHEARKTTEGTVLPARHDRVILRQKDA
jgi:hypothetical protein